LIKGHQGMGQSYLAGAVLSKLEGLHVQNMGLSTLMSDTTRVCVSLLTLLACLILILYSHRKPPSFSCLKK
jgi:hypothetical protein